MDLIRITAGKVIPETVSLNADEVLLVVIVFLVLVNIIFLLVMKYKYTVGLKNRKLREFIEKLMLKKDVSASALNSAQLTRGPLMLKNIRSDLLSKAKSKTLPNSVCLSVCLTKSTA